ncbi:hypothetical protein [Catenulispora sp. MAP5-51]|uniref:hypothetical protein n=1 Tax=unclassified Catenulispora TaxID=414885 RepID=UPI003510E021
MTQSSRNASTIPGGAIANSTAEASTPRGHRGARPAHDEGSADSGWATEPTSPDTDPRWEPARIVNARHASGSSPTHRSSSAATTASSCRRQGSKSLRVTVSPGTARPPR